MRRNSGKDESRNQHLDPTTRDRERERGESGTAVLDKDAKSSTLDEQRGQRTTEMGSDDRKEGEEGEAA